MSPASTTSPTSPQAYGVLALGVLGISLGSIFIRLAQGGGAPSLLIAAARLTIAALMLTPLVFQRHRPDMQRLSRRDLLLAGVSGVFLAMHFATWVTSLQYTSVLISVVLVSTSPLWVALLEVVFLRFRLSTNLKIGLIAVLLGVAIIAIPASSDLSPGKDLLRGALLAIMGAVAVAIYYVIGRKLRAQLPVIPYIWLVYGSGAILLLVIIALSRVSVTGYSGDAYLWLMASGLIPQLIGHSSLNYALGYLPATFVSLSTQLEPVISAIFAFFLFSEHPGLPQIVGSVVLLTGIFLASLAQFHPAPVSEG
jgi:drug/metabolite transporter (DMT)-like permease